MVIFFFLQQGNKSVAKELMLRGRECRCGPGSGWLGASFLAMEPSDLPDCSMYGSLIPWQRLGLHFWFQPERERPDHRICPGQVHSHIPGRLSLPRGHRYHNHHQVSSHSIPTSFSPPKRLMRKHKWPAEGTVTPQFFCTNCSQLTRMSKIFFVLGAQPKDASGKEGQRMVPDTH